MSRGWQTFIAIAGVLFVATVAASVYTLSKTAETAKRVTRLERHPCRDACRKEIVGEVVRRLSKRSDNKPSANSTKPPEREIGGGASTGNSPPSEPGPSPPGGGSGGNGNPPVGDPPTTPGPPNPGPVEQVAETVCALTDPLVPLPAVCN